MSPRENRGRNPGFTWTPRLPSVTSCQATAFLNQLPLGHAKVCRKKVTVEMLRRGRRFELSVLAEARLRAEILLPHLSCVSASLRLSELTAIDSLDVHSFPSFPWLLVHPDIIHFETCRKLSF